MDRRMEEIKDLIKRLKGYRVPIKKFDVEEIVYLVRNGLAKEVQ